MKTIVIEFSIAIATLFIAYKLLLFIFSKRIEPTNRGMLYNLLLGICGLPFAISFWNVIPQLSIVLSPFQKDGDWSKLVEYGGGNLLLIIVSGILSILFSFIIFNSISKEKPFWELLNSDEKSTVWFLAGIIICFGLVFGSISGEIAKTMIPYSDVPFNY